MKKWKPQWRFKHCAGSRLGVRGPRTVLDGSEAIPNGSKAVLHLTQGGARKRFPSPQFGAISRTPQRRPSKTVLSLPHYDTRVMFGSRPTPPING